MKNLYLYMCILLYGYTAIGQKNDHWQLGKSDLDFSTNPNTVNTVSTINGNNYGKASVSDSNGDLLFYTDGIDVWTKNHTIMTNGDDISPWPQYMGVVLIVPHPGDINKYFIFRTFTVISSNDGPSISSYYVYSVVDFSNNALGEITINPDSIYPLNQYTAKVADLTHYATYSPMVCVKSYSGNFYWLILQDGNNLLSCKIDNNGINSPVISTFGNNTIYNVINSPSYNGSLNGISKSMFRLASNGTISKLYGLEYSTLSSNNPDPLSHRSKFYSLDFNDSTGIFTNFQQIQTYFSTDNYGISNNFELSPDLQKAYFVQYKAPVYSNTTNNAIDGQIIVKDLLNLTSQPRLLYEFSSPTTPSSGFYALQKDKYDNLLISSTSATANKNKYVHIVNNPNSFTGSSVQLNYVSLNNNTISALPQLIHNAVIQCQGDIVLNTTETFVNHEYKSYSKITTNTNYVVNSGADITLHAEEAIYLEPNTDVKSGSKFLAEIFECPVGNGRYGSFNEQNGEQGTVALVDATKLYPNPNNGSFEITLGKEITGDLLVVVYDIYGKTVYSGNAKTNRFAVDVPNLSTGM
ncbi:MAG: T9SS type A sorting domain-containing protein, partial [Bacteroidota bacterium]